MCAYGKYWSGIVLGQALATLYKAGECMVVSTWGAKPALIQMNLLIQEKSSKGI